jgi:alkylated DNA nucleotide flippase Atl1
MRVAAVYRRPLKSQPPEECGKIDLREGVGIDGDCHASSESPRQVLLVSTGAYEACHVPPKGLRENILIQADTLNLPSGSRVRIGSHAVLRITFRCEPCGRLNSVRPKLSRDIGDMRGHLARVVQSGTVKPGDRIHIESGVFRPFPDLWKDRVIDLVRMLPTDCVVSYALLAELAGVPKAFCRVFPRLLRSQPDLPWQRVVPANQLNTRGNAPQPRHWVGDAIFEE